MEAKKAALNHLQIIQEGLSAAGDGQFLELRTFDEKEKSGNGSGRNIFVPVNATPEELSETVKWLTSENKKGRGVFVGVNPRARQSGTKQDVEKITTAFLDLDIGKRGIEAKDAIAEINDLSPIKPNLITETGGGLHVYYFMQPTDSYDSWRDLQETLYDKFKHLGADRAVVTDTARVLRLTGFKNWKYEKETGGRDTSVVEFTPAADRTPSIGALSELFDVKPKTKIKNQLPGQIPEGGTEVLEGRNQLLFREASRLRNNGYSESEMYGALSAINIQRCIPPLSDEEVQHIAQSASRYTPTSTLGNSDDPAYANQLGYKLGQFLQEEFKPVEWLIHGLNDAEIGIINAIPNAGKTTMMLNLATSMACGRPFHPFYEGGTPKRIMYFDFENRKAFLQKDIRQMMSNFTLEEQTLIQDNLFVAVDQEIYGAEMNLSNQEHLDLVLREALNHQADLIIFDTMAAAFTFANENDNSEAEKVVIKPLKHIARTTGAAILLVHHIGKSGETGDRSKLYAGRGASAFAAAARAVYVMEALKDGNGRRVDNHVVLSAPKVKGKPFDDTVFALDFPRRWFDTADIVLPDETSRQEQIWNVITRPMKRKEIADTLAALGIEVSDSTLGRALKLGISTGRIKAGATQGTYLPGDAPNGGLADAAPEGEIEAGFTITDADVDATGEGDSLN